MSKRRTHRAKLQLIIAYQRRMLAHKQKERRARRRRLIRSFVSSTLNRVITRRCERLEHHEATYLGDESRYNSIKHAKLQKDSRTRVVLRQRQTRLPAAVMTKLFRRARLIGAQRLSTRVRRNARTCVRRYQRTHSPNDRRLLRFARQALKIRRRLYHYRQQRGRRRPISARLAVRSVRPRVVPRLLTASQPRLRRAATRSAHCAVYAHNFVQRRPRAAFRRCTVLRARLAALAPKTFCSAPRLSVVRVLSARATRHRQRLSAAIVAKTLHTWRRLRLASSASRRRCRSRRKPVTEVFKLRRIRLSSPAERVLSGVEIKYDKKVARQDVRDGIVEER